MSAAHTATPQCSCGFDAEKHDGHSLRCAVAMHHMQRHAIDSANERLVSENLPTYDELLHVNERIEEKFMKMHDRARLAEGKVDDLVRRALDVLEGLENMKLSGAMPVRVEKLVAALAKAGAA